MGRRRNRPAEIVDVDVDWTRYADGRAWRLKRKSDFADVDPGRAREAAEDAAEKMGKAALTVRDKAFPDKFIWVQFADHKVKIGQPCPCGSRRLLRVHENFARCPQCRAQILLTKNEDETRESRAVRVLRELRDVRLAKRGRTGDLDLFRGVADQDGEPVFLIAQIRTDDGEELTRELVYERIVAIDVVPFAELDGVADPSTLERMGDRGWDILL